jgi:NAD(P)H-flavin reductase
MERTAVRGRLTWQVATVATLTRETASVCTIELEPPDWPGHRAGQHLDVRLTAADGYSAERSYSIASAPGERLAVTVERLDDGEGSPYLTEELRAGDEAVGPGRRPARAGDRGPLPQLLRHAQGHLADPGHELRRPPRLGRA